MASPYAAFNGIPFDWGQGSPQKVRKNGADYYTGSILCYAQTDFDAIWALRVVINVRPIGDASTRVYIDSWQLPTDIEHQLSMSNGREQHLAILSDMSMDTRYWRATGNDPTVNGVVALAAKVEFLLLS